MTTVGPRRIRAWLATLGAAVERAIFARWPGCACGEARRDIERIETLTGGTLLACRGCGATWWHPGGAA